MLDPLKAMASVIHVVVGDAATQAAGKGNRAKARR